jgi:hypothetical protein
MAGLEGTVHLPVFGTVKKKTAVFAGIGAPVLVLGIWYIRQRKASQAAAAAAQTAASSGSAGTVTDPAGNTCSALDPVTGYCPGTEEDQQALALAQSYDDGTDDTDLGDTGVSSPVTTTSTPSPVITTNAQWAGYAEQLLGSDGSDAIAAAISKYISGQPVTAAQQTIIQEAIAVAGSPPVSGPSGDPPGLNTTATNTGTGTTTTGPTAPVTPTSPGSPSSPSPVTTAPTGFRVVSVTNGDTVNLAWNPVPGATGYVIAYGPTSGSQAYKQGVAGGATSAATVAGVGAGSAGKHYFELWATPAKTGGPHAGPIEATTTATKS